MSPGDPQSFNRYAYCDNDPINHLDPLGLALKDIGVYQTDDPSQANPDWEAQKRRQVAGEPKALPTGDPIEVGGEGSGGTGSGGGDPHLAGQGGDKTSGDSGSAPTWDESVSHLNYSWSQGGPKKKRRGVTKTSTPLKDQATTHPTGHATVYFWAPDPLKRSPGHLAIKFGEDIYISVYPPQPDGKGLYGTLGNRSYPAKFNRVPEDWTRGKPDGQLELVGVDVNAVSQWFGNLQKSNPTWSTGHNCADYVLEALDVAGFYVPEGRLGNGFVTLPGTTFQKIQRGFARPSRGMSTGLLGAD